MSNRDPYSDFLRETRQAASTRNARVAQRVCFRCIPCSPPCGESLQSKKSAEAGLKPGTTKFWQNQNFFGGQAPV